MSELKQVLLLRVLVACCNSNLAIISLRMIKLIALTFVFGKTPIHKTSYFANSGHPDKMQHTAVFH